MFTRHGHQVLDGRGGQLHTQDLTRCKHSRNCADELSGDIPRSIPAVYPSQPEKSQRDRRIHRAPDLRPNADRMIMNVVTATAVPIMVELETAERPSDLKGDSSLYVSVPQMQVHSIRAPSSVLSMTYSFQCKVAASITDADRARVVTGYRRGMYSQCQTTRSKTNMLVCHRFM